MNVRWDDSNIRTAYANVCRLSTAPDEISIQFGMEHSDDLLQREVTVTLSQRIVMNPMTAKRLSLILNDAMAAYAAPAPPSGPTALRTLMESISEGARRPFRRLDELDARYLLGGSFKMNAQGVQGGRYLITIAKPTLAEPRDEK